VPPVLVINCLLIHKKYPQSRVYLIKRKDHNTLVEKQATWGEVYPSRKEKGFLSNPKKNFKK